MKLLITSRARFVGSLQDGHQRVACIDGQFPTVHHEPEKMRRQNGLPRGIRHELLAGQIIAPIVDLTRDRARLTALTEHFFSFGHSISMYVDPIRNGIELPAADDRAMARRHPLTKARDELAVPRYDDVGAIRTIF
jgi:hypothetical protein